MAEIRQGYLDDYTQNTSGNIGIGTSSASDAKLEIIGGKTTKDLNVTGIATFGSVSGFIEKHTNYTENVNITNGDSATLSGEIVVGVGLTMTVGTSVTTGQGDINSMKVFKMFQPPSGTTNTRPAGKPGALFYNFDFKTIEFFDGSSWRQVDYTTTSSRGVFGGGQPGLSGVGVQDDYEYINIASGGNAQSFGELFQVNGSANWAGASSATRGIFFGGSNPNNNYMNAMEYITIASTGNGKDFGNLTQRTSYVGACASSTRGIRVGGYLGTPASGPTTNALDYVEISTLGDALDFADMTQPRYVVSACGSATRGIISGGAGDNPYPPSSSIDVIVFANKANAVRFGDLTTTRWGAASSSNSTRAVVAAGRGDVPATVTETSVDSMTIATEGNAIDFAELEIPRDRFTSCANQVRSVLIGGQDNPGGTVTNSIEFIIISSGGKAADFGDKKMATQYAQGSVSDSHGGLGGF